MTDITGKIINRLRNLRLAVLELYSNFAMFFVLLIKGIQTGKGIRFWGTAVMIRYPSSSIYIGKGTSFRSDATSNLIGVNRKCIIATHEANARLIIGCDCGFSGTVIGVKEKITIGDNVLCGANTLITDFDWHGLTPENRLTYSGDSREVCIGNNVFIGYGVVVLKGVTIGENSVIGANSVVTRSIPANVIAGGNPCKVLKDL
jgi:acetyltransferase-like isoleucine patch superfamily enzyme